MVTLYCKILLPTFICRCHLIWYFVLLMLWPSYFFECNLSVQILFGVIVSYKHSGKKVPPQLFLIGNMFPSLSAEWIGKTHWEHVVQKPPTIRREADCSLALGVQTLNISLSWSKILNLDFFIFIFNFCQFFSAMCSDGPLSLRLINHFGKNEWRYRIWDLK